jgi:hypothetical protein
MRFPFALLLLVSAILAFGCRSRGIMPSDQEIDRNEALSKVRINNDKECEGDCERVLATVARWHKIKPSVSRFAGWESRGSLVYEIETPSKNGRDTVRAVIYAYVKGADRMQMVLTFGENSYYLDYRKTLGMWGLYEKRAYAVY